MNEPALKPTGKGRHGKRATPDVRHSEETKRAALAMFIDGKRPAEVSKALGVKFQTCYTWWANYRRELIACVCAETSSRNCPQHAEPSNADHGDEA